MPEVPQNQGRDNTHSELSGRTGDVVQARDVSGGIHFHYGQGSQNAPPQQLPSGIRVFVNRLSELGRLDDLLGALREKSPGPVVYVIAGTAGVGKTSLALHWAHRVREHFPDGQLYLDLRGYDPGPPMTADQALERFLLTLEVPATAIPQGMEAKASPYRSMLAQRRMLIILDNAGTVGQVRPLIPGVGGSLAIVTSRSPLSGLVVRDGAQRSTLDKLTEAESIELLTATTADYRIGDDPADIALLARLCAYLPLALRIAAERAASRPAMPLSELIADLRDEAAVWNALSTGEEDGADAVRTVFAWSYRALPRHAAGLFCFLGLHPGGEFSRDAAAVIAGGAARPVRNSLDVLTSAFLLENKGSGRYQFHDLLRAYAVDRARFEISQAEQLAAVARVCSWYMETAYQCVLKLAHDTTRLFTPEHSSGFNPLTFTERVNAAEWYDAEKSNLVAAVQVAFDTQQWLLAWQLAVALERLYSSYNHFQDWRITSLTGLRAAQELGDPEKEAVMCESLGRLFRMTLQLDDAAVYHERAISIHRERGDLLGAAKGQNGLGWVHLFAHRLERARAVLAEALGIVRSMEDDYWTATLLYSLGYAYLQLERGDEAQTCLTAALQIFRDLGDRLYESMVLTAVSLLQHSRGQPGNSLATAQEAVEIAREMENPLWEGTALLYLGDAELATEQPGEALVSYQRAVTIFRQEGDLSREAMAVDSTGRAYSQLDRVADAASFHRYAAAMHRQVGDRWKLSKSLSYLADALPAPEVGREADAYRREALALLHDYTDVKSMRLKSRIRAALDATGGMNDPSPPFD